MIKEMAKIFLVAALLLTISACEKQSCKNVSCPVGQACNSGKCFCADGYEGTNCDVESNTKYVTGYLGGSGYKDWQVYETCNSSSSNFPGYNSTITHNSSNPSEIEINNFFGRGTVYANIRTDQSNQGNIVEINTQDCGGVTVSGQGTYDVTNSRITFQLNYTLFGASYNCTHTFY